MKPMPKSWLGIITSYWRTVLLMVFLVGLDLSVYFLFAFLLMSYEDSYTPNEGAFYSIESMNIAEALAWVGYLGWSGLNFLVVGFLVIHWLRNKIRHL